MFNPQVIKNLSSVLDRQKEKLEKMRAFTQWRMKHTEAKEEVKLWHHRLEWQSIFGFIHYDAPFMDQEAPRYKNQI